MNGLYRIYDDGELIAESANVITDDGKRVVLQYLVGGMGGLAEYMAFGVGQSTPSVLDRSLDFEYHRSTIDLKQSEPLSSRIVFRATIPDQKTFEIHEIGLYLDDIVGDEQSPNYVVTSFEQYDEADWLQFDGVDFEQAQVYVGGRTGTDSYMLNVTPSDTHVLVRPGSFGDFDTLQPGDQFALAYELLSGDATQIELRFIVDANNYRSYTFEPDAGFNIHRWHKSEFVQVGSAPWSEFVQLEVHVSADSAGAQIMFDGLRYDNITANERPVLISRTLLDEPIQKRGTAELQIEYIMNIAFQGDDA